MPPAPAAKAAPPPKGKGKKIAGMTQTQLLIVLGIALAGGAWLLYRRRKTAAAASGAGTGTCADGSSPDANGNCPQASQDFSGQLQTLQDEIAALQASAGSGAGSSGGGSTGGGDTGSSGGTGGGGGTPAPAPPPGPGGGGTPPPVTRYPAPTGLQARAESATQAVVSWNPVSPPAPNYTLAVYQLNGKRVQQTTVAGVGGGRISTAVSGLHPSWQYQVHVWANGGQVAPPHASTLLTMPKR
jgi:LPXTG-motif cell wall-anchored protein